MIPRASSDGKITSKEAVQNTAAGLCEAHTFMAIEELERALYFHNIESGLWERAEIFLRKKLEESHQDQADEKFIQAVLNKIKNNFPIKLNDIPNTPINLIPLRTAVWDIIENKPIKYQANHYFFQKAMVDAIEGMPFPTIENFEQQVFGENKSKIKKYRQILAYSLVNGYPIKKAFIFHGPSNCGKSKAVELAEKIVGYENTTNIALQDLLQNRFARARLFNKKLNTHSDLPPTIVRNPGEFKTLTGGDRLGAEHKGKTGFDFVNSAKFIFSCNQIPEVDPEEVDSVFFGRWEFLDFENVIPTEKQDPNIVKKMIPELDGYCFQLIQELRELLVKKKFSELSDEECQEVWMSHSVSAPQFVQEYIEPSPGNSISCQFLLEKYLEFCKERKLPAQTSTALGKTLKGGIPECYQGYSSSRLEGEHFSMKVWRNIKLRETVPSMPPILSTKKQKEVIVPPMPTVSPTLKMEKQKVPIRFQNNVGIDGTNDISSEEIVLREL